MRQAPAQSRGPAARRAASSTANPVPLAGARAALWDGAMSPSPSDSSASDDLVLGDRRRGAPIRAGTAGRTRAQLLDDEGLAPRDLRRGQHHRTVERLATDVYRGADDSTHPDAREIAVLQGLTRGTARLATHDTAAALLGLWEERLRRPHHLTVPRDGGRVRRPGLIVPHRADIPGEFIAEVAGIPVTTPAWTWADRAASQSLVEAVVSADVLLRSPRIAFEGPGVAVAAPEDLLAAVQAKTGSRGIRQVRRAAGLARPGADSPQETRLRVAIMLAGLPEPEVNEWVLDAQGGRLFQPDLLFRELRVAVQYEGPHHSDPRQVERDVHRAELAADHGWIEVRITRRHAVDGWAPAIARIVDALRRQGWDGALIRR